MGPGGVGKTTVSAALARQAAERGRRVAVLTIDPARRLADAMGLSGLDDGLRPVWIQPGGPGRLDAAMIDTRSSYDGLMSRLAGDEGTSAIFENTVYRAFSRTLARSHAYVAMERLYDVVRRGEHDFVVLDTPPTRSALDILDAPGRLVQFLDEGVVSWFLDPPAKGPLAKLLPRGGAAAIRLLSLLTSRRLASETAAFFSLLVGFRRGFAERAEQTQAALRAPSTAFVLVTAPQPTSLDDAAYLSDGLLQRRVPLSLVIFNRAYVPSPSKPYEPLRADGDDYALSRITAVSEAERATIVETARKLSAARARVGRQNEVLEQRMLAFLSQAGASIPWGTLPELDEDVRDLETLSVLARAFRERSHAAV
jgi:anion-transporting  ArsA/GET3 family ATPase